MVETGQIVPKYQPFFRNVKSVDPSPEQAIQSLESIDVVTHYSGSYLCWLFVCMKALLCLHDTLQCLPQNLLSYPAPPLRKQLDPETQVVKGPAICQRAHWPRGSWNRTWLEQDWRTKIDREWHRVSRGGKLLDWVSLFRESGRGRHHGVPFLPVIGD